MPRLCYQLFVCLSLILSGLLTACSNVAAPTANTNIKKGQLLYSSNMATAESINNWQMEGPGKIDFKDGWMQMHSPNEQMHHVFWCPEDFPDSFIAEWQVQNLKTDAGLVIVFFAATGVNGEDIFAPHLVKRDGTFTQYTEGDITSYHISYYANAAHNPNRGHANLRKNNTFTLLQQGAEGIETESTRIHDIRLVKRAGFIQLYIDDRLVIDHLDQNQPHQGGKIGFRQMKWTHFQYRDFKVWELGN